ncbi:MAG: hypothetical protein GC192_01595 [Bacteroidetes bacterium]|nr:hypothetical protein [Bacteroidota bacterium]
MSKRPIRVTGFTRFFLVMLVVAPLAYIGASYYNGEDGIQKIKDLLKIESSANSVDKKQVSSDSEPILVNESPSLKTLELENRKLKEELEFKQKRNDELYRENEELKRKLESTEKALEESKTK